MVIFIENFNLKYLLKVILAAVLDSCLECNRYSRTGKCSRHVQYLRLRVAEREVHAFDGKWSRPLTMNSSVKVGSKEFSKDGTVRSGP